MTLSFLIIHTWNWKGPNHSLCNNRLLVVSRMCMSFNGLAFQFLHSLPVITWLFLCFTHNLQVIKLSSDSKWSHSYWSILFRPHLLKIMNFTLYWQTFYFHFNFCGRMGRGFILFDSWGFWLVVLCGNWEEVELAI